MGKLCMARELLNFSDTCLALDNRVFKNIIVMISLSSLDAVRGNILWINIPWPISVKEQGELGWIICFFIPSVDLSTSIINLAIFLKLLCPLLGRICLFPRNGGMLRWAFFFPDQVVCTYKNALCQLITNHKASWCQTDLIFVFKFLNQKYFF